MAKKKKVVKEKVDQRLTFLNAQIAAAKQAFNNDNIYAISEHSKMLYGIPFPSLALEYLFTSNVMLMSKLIGLAGQKGSLKSSFGFEILRWFIEWRGLGALVETENKISEQCGNVLQDMQPYCQLALVKSTQAAQQQVSFCEEKHASSEDMKDVPLCIVIDSLTGSEGDKTKEDMVTTGHAVKGYSENALIWTTWLRAKSADLIGKPISIVFTNHLKEKVGGAVRPGMPAQKTTPGGKGQEFHATYYVHMALMGKFETLNRQGKELSMVMEKNSMGPDKNKISSDFLWWYADNNPHDQLSYFDWYSTTAKFLVDPKTPTAVKNIVNLKCTAKKFSSNVLGFKDLTGTEAGYFIENSPVYRAAIQGALNIPLRNVWDEGKIMDAKDCTKKISVNLPPGTLSEDFIESVKAFNEKEGNSFVPSDVSEQESTDVEVAEDGEVPLFEGTEDA